jgi:APA family basic amino acid/polyamine antiporter
MAAVPGGTRASLREQLLRRKPVAAMTAETGADTGEGELKRTIGLFQLTAFGVGATIGTGIFIVLTQAVPVGGPATILSFVFRDRRPAWRRSSRT